MDSLKDRLARELGEVPVAHRSASEIIDAGDRRRGRRRIGTVGLASVLALGSIALISRAFGGSGGAPADTAELGEGRIVFSTDPWENIPTQIYSVWPDGTGLERLTRPDAQYSSPAVSPDGSRIAFVRLVENVDEAGREVEGIFVMAMDGSGAHELLRTGEPTSLSVGQIAWSPDGSQIAFIRNFYVGTSEADFRYELWVMGADGSEPRKLSDRQIVSFSWSPDGSRIAFTEQSIVGQRFRWDLYVMDVDGSNVQPLTDDGQSRKPSWSPDGDAIAYQRWVKYGLSHLYVIDLGRPDIDPYPVWTREGRVDSFTWSPDSSKLAIAYDPREDRCSILTVTLEGKVSTILESHRPQLPGSEVPAEPPLCAWDLAWAPLATEGA